MRYRTLFAAVILLGALGLASCSAATPGTPSGSDPSSTPAVVGSDSSEPAGPGATDPGLVPPTDSESGDVDEPVDLSDLSSATAAITGLSGILSDECMAAAGVSLSLGMLVLAPMMGGAELTQQDIDEAFAGIEKVPAELQDSIEVVRNAAKAAAGQPVAKAAEVLGSAEVSAAMDQIAKYMEVHCPAE